MAFLGKKGLFVNNQLTNSVCLARRCLKLQYYKGKMERSRLEKQLLFYTEKLASALPNVTRVIPPSW
jgi:hypothetical protein